MIYDFIETSYHFKDKDMINWANIEQTGTSIPYQREYFSLKGCRGIDIVHFPTIRTLSIKGSPAYYWQGHNFNFSIPSFVDSINHIGDLLGVNLWTSLVNSFEVGLIMQVPEKPVQYIKGHREGKGQTLYDNPKDKGYFRAFQDADIRRKLYDAKRNIKMKQGLKMQGIIQEQGWNPDSNYLKWELHYNRPQILNNGRSPLLADIVSLEYQSRFKESLYTEYQSLYKMKEIELPTNKKFLSTPDIIAIGLNQIAINQGNTLEDTKKNLYSLINEIPDSILSKPDKDARKRQINAIFKRIEDQPQQSKWDLTDLLEGGLLNK